MERLYGTFCKLKGKKLYNMGLVPKRDFIQKDSQFLNSKPQSGPSRGIIPMTGKGIEADVNDV